MVGKYQMLTSTKKKICARVTGNEKGENVVRTRRSLTHPPPPALFHIETNK